MTAHARYDEIKRWAEATGRRSIELWMAKATASAMDRRCRERGVKRAELLSSPISEASGEHGRRREVGRAQYLFS
jgi:hypothetical protein